MKKVYLKGMQIHPSIERALEIIKKSFTKLCLEGQDILGTKEKWEKVRVFKKVPFGLVHFKCCDF